jgi:hypothetical protein
MFARSEAKVVVQQGMKYCIFVSHSTTIHMASYPSDNGSPVIKSIEILVHGSDGMDRDIRIPARCCRED